MPDNPERDWRGGDSWPTDPRDGERWSCKSVAEAAVVALAFLAGAGIMAIAHAIAAS